MHRRSNERGLREDWKRDEVDTGRMRPRSTPPLLALLASPRLRERVRKVLRLGNVGRIIGPAAFTASWSELRAMAECNPGSPALVDTFHGPGCPFDAASDATSGTWGRATPVICFSPLDPDLVRRVNEAGMTLAGHLRPGVDDKPHTINATIVRSIDIQCALGLRRRVRQSAPPFAAEALGHALDLAFAPCAVSELAKRLGTPERTLRYRCRANRIPAPSRLLSLARIFTVQRLAEWSRQPYGAVAVALGFSHQANYRRRTRGVLGLTPTDLGRRGSHDYVARTIIERLS